MNMNVSYKTALLILLIPFAVFSRVRLPKIISDGMVIQRDAAVKIWGWADPQEVISVSFLNSKYQTTADSNGEWHVYLAEHEAGGPFTMHVAGSNSIIINNILIGDVWICSGQSNMELPMSRVSWIYKDEIEKSENNFIRQFAVPQKYNFNKPENDLQGGNWKSADPQNVLDFSAAAYFFAKELYEKYKVPIGLVNSSLGGSPANSWMSEDALQEFPKYLTEAYKFRDSNLIKQIEESDKTRIQQWFSLLRVKDEGYRNKKKIWFDPELDDTNWEVMKVPNFWQNTPLNKISGAVWFRTEVVLPLEFTQKNSKLILGRIIDSDSVFINGKFVGSTSYEWPPRRYDIPSGILKQGKNSLVVRVVCTSGRGAIVPEKEYCLVAGQDTINLSGSWRYRIGALMEPLASQTFIRWKPLGLYNAMIAPLINYRIKGVIWYQGESDAGTPAQYQKDFPALIKNWRQKWAQGDFPFLFVQLANFMQRTDEPAESNWALLREAQLKSLSVPNTGMAVTIDIGEGNDIHPLNKKDVGKRLALAACKFAYGDNEIVYSGPIYKSMNIEGNKVTLSFDHVGSGLIAKGTEKLKYFSIAGTDSNFVWADAKIEEDKVIVWNDEIKHPIAVRYAWADNPEGANLYNKEGLPASPFRTDSFSRK